MIHLLTCFGAGLLGMLCMFILLCFLPEITDIFTRKK